MHGYEVRLELFEATPLALRLLSSRPARSPAPVAERELMARVDELDPGRCRRLVFAGDADPTSHPSFERILARCRDRGLTGLAIEASGVAFSKPRSAEALSVAGVETAFIVCGGVRERVYEAVMKAPGSWRSAMQGVASAAESPLSTYLVVPVLGPNADDVVPLVEWVLALESSVDGVLLYVPPMARVGSDERRLTLSQKRIAEVAAEAFGHCRRAGIEYGFSEQRGVSPCASDALDGFATVWVDHLRALRRAAPDDLRRIEPCDECSLRYACAGLERAYVETHGEADLAPVTLERSTAWRLKRTHRLEERDYKNISAFDNDHQGRGRSLVRVNGHCQMACAFCFVDRTVPDYGAASLALEITALAEQQTDHLVLSGGEPTLHPELPQLIAHAKGLGFSTIEIQTNGLRAADLEYARELVAAGLTKATVSLHSTDQAKSDEITKLRGAFPKTVAGLANFRRLGIDTQIAHVITKANYEELPETVRFLRRELPEAEGHLSICFAIAQGISDLVYSWTIPRFDEIKPFFREALDFCLESGIGFGGMIGQGGYPPCMLDGELDYYRHNLENVYRSADYTDQFYKSPRCTDCSFDPYCIGVRRDYVATYGDEEITPFQCDDEELANVQPLPPSAEVLPREGHMPRPKRRLPTVDP